MRSYTTVPGLSTCSGSAVHTAVWAGGATWGLRHPRSHVAAPIVSVLVVKNTELCLRMGLASSACGIFSA